MYERPRESMRELDYWVLTDLRKKKKIKKIVIIKFKKFKSKNNRKN